MLYRNKRLQFVKDDRCPESVFRREYSLGAVDSVNFALKFHPYDATDSLRWCVARR